MRDAILSRISTRTFVEENLTKSQITEIEDTLKKYNQAKGPFGHSFELTFSLNDDVENKGKKIGTYGLIKNAPAFIGGVSENTMEAIVDFGYIFEHVILELTEKGYSTCWLGGTFRRKHYRKKLAKNQLIPAISPVGYRANKRSRIDKFIRNAAQSQNRLDNSKNFFHYDTLEPYGDDGNIIIKQSLCLVRRGPSASNKQPWRIFAEGNRAHFYIERNKVYGKALQYDMQALDIGIALAHYDIGIRFFNKIPIYNRLEVKDIERKEYVITVEY